MNVPSVRQSAVVVVLVLGAAASGCVPLHVRVEPRVPENEIVVKPSLVTFLKTTPEPKIVLRVPVPQGNLAQEEQKNSEALNSVYNVIEKELLKAGFTVRDRALLTEVLRNNPKIDYRAIKEKIDTQLILEIVSLTPWDYSNPEYKRADTGAPGQAPIPFKLVGSRIMAKLIMVETGEIGGIITYYAWPKDWECYFVFQEGSDPYYVRVASKAGVVDERYSWYEAPTELGAAWFIKGMLKELKK